MRTQHNYRISCGKPTKIAKDNRWKAWLSWTDYESESRKKKAVYWRDRPTKADKAAAEDKLLKELKEQEADPSFVATRVKQFRDQQNADLVRKKIKPSTWEATDYNIKRLLTLLEEPSDGLGPYTWRDFPRRVSVFENDLEDWTYRGKKISPDKHRATYFLAKKIVRMAQLEELIFVQPLNNNPPKRDVSVEAPLVHSRTDFRAKLLPQLDDDLQLKTIVLLCAEAGLRFGEARGLKWGDIEWPDSNVVSASDLENMYVQQEDGTLILNPLFRPQDQVKVSGAWVHVQRSAPDTAITKTRTGMRYVPLGHEVVSHLNRLANKAPWEKDDEEYIFVDKHGNLASKDGLRSRLQRRLDKAGLPTEQAFQTLRRCYGTWNVLNGTEPPMLMAWMGHADFSTTMKYYVALDEKMKPAGRWAEPNLG